ncbi:MAG: zinc-binding dehydrogenase [Armatimonadia bacterium]|nr:zinc-binding dehydrogenase [Armatimonadia bacterium]
MRATALICDSERRFELREVDIGEPGPGQALIRTLYTGVSIGTEFALIRGRISWGPFPICTGYQGVGVVEALGPELDGFQVGDKVYYRGHQGPMRTEDGQTVSTVAGTHCSHLIAGPHPTHGMDPLPEGAPPEEASCFVMPAVGLLGVDMARPKVRDKVVVYGAGAIGLGAIAWLALRGCTVTAIDLDPGRLGIARRLGADHVIDASSADVPTEVEGHCPGGADVVFEASGNRDLVGPAIELCRTEGTFVWQGNYGEEPLPFRFMPAHGRRLTMVFPCDDGYGPNRRAVMKNLAMGSLRWGETITHRVSWSDAPGFFADVETGARSDVVQAVLHWSDS